jgi:hypothetical protein
MHAIRTVEADKGGAGKSFLTAVIDKSILRLDVDHLPAGTYRGYRETRALRSPIGENAARRLVRGKRISTSFALWKNTRFAF